MAKQMKIRKGDRVVVLTGKDKGRSGEVLRAIPKEDRVVVQGVNMVTKHQRPTASNQGGIVQIEASIHVSNVAMADPRDGAASRIGVKIDGERKLRVARRSGEVIDR
ncbi:50S ribosomal protein L24 [Aquibaculum sediminis]|uniref:50S ribosomal protein L24 n=1 Tax=Aquibaculum sediminis TaxID=3231907 RepID=UPI00345592DE